MNTTAAVAERSAADRYARRVLGLAPDAPKVSLIDAQNAFSRSILISATRCLLTYVAIPLLAPLLNLAGVFGPVLGIALSLVSMVAIVFAARRFFAADHPWRWKYAAIGAGVFVLVTVQMVIDIESLIN